MVFYEVNKMFMSVIYVSKIHYQKLKLPLNYFL